VTSPPRRAVAGRRGRRFDLDAIESALAALQDVFPEMNPLLKDRHDPLDDDVVGNMVAGYTFIDDLVADNVDIFAFGHLKDWLELNALVLCGQDRAQRERLADHLQATEERFYDQEEGSIRDVVEWYERSSLQSVWKRAAGVYIRMVSEPQLFPEGNHRSGVLVMSYMLARAGGAPVVLTPANAAVFFDLSTAIKQVCKHSLTMMISMTHFKRELAGYLKSQANGAYLLPAA
jgi:prophage maintenance system killer protein